MTRVKIFLLENQVERSEFLSKKRRCESKEEYEIRLIYLDRMVLTAFAANLLFKFLNCVSLKTHTYEISTCLQMRIVIEMNQ